MSARLTILIAARDASGVLHAQHTRTVEARISAGISGKEPRLSEAGMARGLDAIISLLADACATRAQQFAGEAVPARQVQVAFLASLNGAYARVAATDEILQTLPESP